jgi:hypothetical protein
MKEENTTLSIVFILVLAGIVLALWDGKLITTTDIDGDDGPYSIEDDETWGSDEVINVNTNVLVTSDGHLTIDGATIILEKAIIVECGGELTITPGTYITGSTDGDTYIYGEGIRILGGESCTESAVTHIDGATITGQRRSILVRGNAEVLIENTEIVDFDQTAIQLNNIGGSERGVTLENNIIIGQRTESLLSDICLLIENPDSSLIRGWDNTFQGCVRSVQTQYDDTGPQYLNFFRNVFKDYNQILVVVNDPWTFNNTPGALYRNWGGTFSSYPPYDSGNYWQTNTITVDDDRDGVDDEEFRVGPRQGWTGEFIDNFPYIQEDFQLPPYALFDIEQPNNDNDDPFLVPEDTVVTVTPDVGAGAINGSADPIDEITIEWGDGSPPLVLDTGFSTPRTHTYNDPGTYSITMQVTTEGGQTNPPPQCGEGIFSSTRAVNVRQIGVGSEVTAFINAVCGKYQLQKVGSEFVMYVPGGTDLVLSAADSWHNNNERPDYEWEVDGQSQGTGSPAKTMIEITTPAGNDYSDVDVSVGVDDGFGGVDDHDIVIRPPPGNSAPTVMFVTGTSPGGMADIEAITIIEGDTVHVKSVSMDADGDMLTETWTFNDPPNDTFQFTVASGAGSQAQWTYEEAGDYTIVLGVSDGISGVTNFDSVLVKVIEGDDVIDLDEGEQPIQPGAKDEPEEEAIQFSPFLIGVIIAAAVVAVLYFFYDKSFIDTRNLWMYVVIIGIIAVVLIIDRWVFDISLGF